MASRDDMCICGHTRIWHNNRIAGNYYPEIKYNACMAGSAKDNSLCRCHKFEKKTGVAEDD